MASFEKENKTVKARLAALRAEMRAHGMNAYLVLSDDFHASEYVSDHFRAREYFSGFTGSAGTLVVLEEKALLWTDGRYFLQAETELAGTGICLMRAREAGVPTIFSYLAAHLREGAVIGFDGRTVSTAFAERLAAETKPIGAILQGGYDLAGIVWKDRPPQIFSKVYEIDAKIAGATRKEKLASVRAEMKRSDVELLAISAPEEIAWLLNLRGSDVACTPVFFSFLLLSADRVRLFVGENAISMPLSEKLCTECGLEIERYDEIYTELARIPGNVRVQYDGKRANSRFRESFSSDVRLVDETSPIVYMKAVKTPAEVQNMRVAHIKDGVALVKFLSYIKTNVKKEKLTERSASAKLQEFRRECCGYLGESFEPIVAYGAHAAIVHYTATEESDVPLAPSGLCLADTGAHYKEGTTDVTRTFALGEVTEKEKHLFTTVLRGHIALASAKFKYGMSGENLDVLARAPLWELGLDYNHGTGHGVGFLLGVHEGPQSIRWQISKNELPVALEEGMILSNEPGVYLAGEFGIRHENLLLLRKGERNEYGQYMYFEPLTLVPFDLQVIDRELLTKKECAWLDDYHKKVYEALSPYLTKEERLFLQEATAPILSRE